MNLTPQAQKAITQLQEIVLGVAETYVTRIEAVKDLLITQKEMLELEDSQFIGYIITLTEIRNDIEAIAGVKVKSHTEKTSYNGDTGN